MAPEREQVRERSVRLEFGLGSRYFLSMVRRINAPMIPVVALVSVALATGVLYAQEYNFRYFGTTEGLNNLAVRQIYQDRIGFIWVSTENGIYRYDGERFEAFVVIP